METSNEPPEGFGNNHPKLSLKMKLLITGGCGFLGSNLAADALQRQDEIIVFDNLSRKGASLNLEWLQTRGKFRFQEGDIRDKGSLVQLIRDFKPDGVFHLAGQVAMTESIKNPDLDFAINAFGTHNVLEAVRNSSPNSIVVYSSTNKVYGDLEQYMYEETATRYQCVDYPNGFDEEIPLSFHSPYGCSKGAADQYTIDYSRIFGLKTVVFRHSSMYGGRQFATTDQGWIGWFCEQAVKIHHGLNTDPIVISGSGKQVRDILHVNDMKTLYLAAMNNIDAAKGQVFNIGGGLQSSLSLLELFHILEDYLKIKIDLQKTPVRSSDQRVFIADTKKALNLLKWSPKISRNEGIEKMIQWIKSQI